MPHVLCAPDKFKGTATAREVAAACARAARASGWGATELPLADGGEGLLEALGGEEVFVTVTGPLGKPVEARWCWLAKEPHGGHRTAVIAMAEASGLVLAGGAEGNDPERATTRGTGELIRDAIEHGATRIIVGCGGSATTDGGAGAVEVLGDYPRIRSVQLIGACDVTTSFVDAAAVFGPQKGADADAIGRLTYRLREQAFKYQRRFGVNVTTILRAGAAGGLGGGLAALGATLRSGFEVVADVYDLDAAIEEADLVITGEGCLDATSFEGKVVGALLEHCAGRAPLAVVAGDATADGRERAGEVPVVSLVERLGTERAFSEVIAGIELVATELLASR